MLIKVSGSKTPYPIVRSTSTPSIKEAVSTVELGFKQMTSLLLAHCATTDSFSVRPRPAGRSGGVRVPRRGVDRRPDERDGAGDRLAPSPRNS